MSALTMRALKSARNSRAAFSSHLSFSSLFPLPCLFLLLALSFSSLPFTRAHLGHHDESPPPPPPANLSLTAPLTGTALLTAPAPEASLSPQSNSGLVANKVGSIFVFLIVPLSGCVLAYLIAVDPEMLKYGILFAAGLFFSIALQHLLADSTDSFRDLLPDDTYPYPFLLALVGYFLTWLADIVVRFVWEKQRHENLSKVQSPAEKTPAHAVSCCKNRRVEAADVESAPPSDWCKQENCPCDGQSCRCAATSWMEFSESREFARASEQNLRTLGFADVILLMLALCFHAVFEGLAVGLSSTVKTVWSTTGSVVLHKFFEGLALGTTLKSQKNDRSALRFFIYAFGFAVMAPIGVGVGIIVNAEAPDNVTQWVDAVGNAMASGVFICVAVSHLMVKAMKPGPSDPVWAPLLKWFCCGLGLMTNSLLMLDAS